MSIHFISGKPGGGKSLYGVKMIVDELVYGHRCVVTNLPLRLPELNEYLQKQYPNKTIDLLNRVILFDEEQMKGFFCIRPPGSRGPELLNKQDWQAGKKPDYTGVNDTGVFYVIDEVHIGFNARAWMDTGADVLYYLSQHRKLGDTVVCITQAINNVDKQFRSVTQDYTYIRNLSKEKMSKFRLPSIFIRQTFNSPATGNEKPMEMGTFRLDVKGLAACYDTAKGVGIHGRSGADARERKTGLPWWTFVILVIAVVYFVAYVVPPMVVKMYDIKPKTKKDSAPTANATNTLRALPTASSTEPKHAESKASSTELPRGNFETNEVTVVGIHRLSRYWKVWLSDGREYQEGDPELQEINTRGVVIDGKLYKRAKPPTSKAEERYGGDYAGQTVVGEPRPVKFILPPEGVLGL